MEAGTEGRVTNGTGRAARSLLYHCASLLLFLLPSGTSAHGMTFATECHYLTRASRRDRRIQKIIKEKQWRKSDKPIKR